jgi:AraC-like DNA-binding protein
MVGMTNALSYRLSFEELSNYFQKTHGEDLSLAPSLGSGYVRVYKIEEGLQARIWDCYFNKPIEVYRPSLTGNPYFTLAFFTDLQALSQRQTNGGNSIIDEKDWDTLFVSSKSTFQLKLPENLRCFCLSVDFSKIWLERNVISENDLQTICSCINEENQILVYESMSFCQKKNLLDVLSLSWKKALGTFYIKSAVLDMVSKFFIVLKEKQSPARDKPMPYDLNCEIEKLIDSNLTGDMPTLKQLANKYSLSESTIKRAFKKKHGTTISVFFLKKKMEYAAQLMKTNNLDVFDVAHAVGYQRKTSFLAHYNKYGRKNTGFNKSE